ncbi:MAG TPA: hypothetical protein VFW07_18765 [Parafilimonas sp.]|nr:hypothetical protein [Parafilimonas sp.]
MINAATIFWKNEEVGKVLNTANDMWYFDADWQPNQSAHTKAFEDIVSKINPDEAMRFPTVSEIVRLKYNNSVSESQKMLVLSLKGSKLLMRLLTDESAAYLEKTFLPPWQPIENPVFYEDELKKQLSFFHPLKWKKIKAIAIRKDTNALLFKFAKGFKKYAIVHLVNKEKASRKLISVKFYNDWSDVFNNRLLHDHNELK